MRVVILAAGRGTRMEGEVPKPLIELRGVPMLVHALKLANEVDSTPIVLATNPVLHSPYAYNKPMTTVYVDKVQSGAAMSLLAAAGQLDEQEPVLVMDCDVLLKPGVLANFADWSLRGFKTAGLHSTLLCFKPTDGSSRYSFVREAQVHTDPFYPRVVEVYEKLKASNIASCGVHCFSSWEVLRNGICEMVHYRSHRNKEYYMSAVHSRIGAASYLMADWFRHVGTKEELEAYAAGK